MALQIIPVYIYTYTYLSIYIYIYIHNKKYQIISMCAGKTVLLNGHHCHHENTSMGPTRCILNLCEILQAKWLPFAWPFSRRYSTMVSSHSAGQSPDGSLVCWKNGACKHGAKAKESKWTISTLFIENVILKSDDDSHNHTTTANLGWIPRSLQQNAQLTPMDLPASCVYTHLKTQI